MIAESGLSTEDDRALMEFQGHMNLMFTRARTLWKESAVRVHPELQPAGYKLLLYVSRVGEANAHQLAETFEMDKSVISRQVRMLEDFGLVDTRPDERDGRLRVITATPRACSVLAEIRGDQANRMRVVLDELTPEEIEAASKVFRLLAEA